ncbi:primosomal protein N' [Janibacter sp. G1551]|uniref:primosomal protein N' n=1 Tax=Janibacter sp. G1551 TaxID=3420440 RepID=UPI003D036659
MAHDADDGQLFGIAEQLPAAVPVALTVPDGVTPAATDPVAEVLVDTGLPHLDRPFEYVVPAEMDGSVRPGVRVKVRFAGQDLTGYVTARRARPGHDGRLAALRKVVSDEPVLTPEVLAAARAIADRYAGTVGDVLRLAIPARHARAEKALPIDAPASTEAPTAASDSGEPTSAWSAYVGGEAFLARVAAGEGPEASWLAAPSAAEPAGDWPRAIAEAAAAALRGDRGSVIVVPDHRDVDRVAAALADAVGEAAFVRLTADQGPQARYTAWLKVLRGHVRVVLGSRAAALAPVAGLGLVAWWDDGDDLHDEPRAPYPHVREMLRIRARLSGAALLSGGFSRSTEVAALVRDGELRTVAAPRTVLRERAPRIVVAGEGIERERDPAAATARIPSQAMRIAREGLRTGPVLLQVPRRGYLPSMSCAGCRRPARCPRCSGPLALERPDAPPRCRWCAHEVRAFECPACGDPRLRASVIGARRTAEEIGRAFPGIPVLRSGAGEVLATVGDAPALVISTPGAEPVAEGGYAAALLLDAWAVLDRPSLDAAEESLRRWLAAAALVRGTRAGGTVVLCGAPDHVSVPPVEALVRWDPAWFAERELDERVELSLPPASRSALVQGPRRALDAALSTLSLPSSAATIGPLPVTGHRPAGRPDPAPGEEPFRALLTVPLADADALGGALRDLRARRSARKEADALLVRIDPADFGA